MLTPTTIRALILLLPLTAVWIIWLWRQPSKREQIGFFLACAWLTWSLFLLNLGAIYFHWWSFQTEDGNILGIPIDLLFGWTLLWGGVPLLRLSHFPAWVILLILGAFDLLIMPLLSPVLELGNNWLVGEFTGLLFCFLPAYWLAQVTAANTHLTRRIWLLALTFGGLLFVLLPLLILELTAGTLDAVWQRPFWLNNLLLQILAIPLLWGVSALHEFAHRGEGTPLPFDPPQQLVTTGLYAYLANPMQASTALTFLVLGLFLQNPIIALGAVITFVYSVGFANWSELGDMENRFGRTWLQYKSNVSNWNPRRRPYYPVEKAPAHLFVAESCIPCSQLAHWFMQRNPIGLQILPAETHPSQSLTRLTYESADGHYQEVGVAALARGLEHIHLGWALLAVVMRLPLIRPFLQLVTDAVGGDKQTLPSEKSAIVCTPKHQTESTQKEFNK